MSFLDTIKDRLSGRLDDDYYEDDYYEDDPAYDENGYAPESRRPSTSSSTRLLGTTPRPEAESVSVYTRSGRPVAAQQQRPQPPAPRSYAEPAPVEPRPQAPAPANTSVLPVSTPRVTSGQLPPYVLRPVSYDDVQTVVRRVRTNQPVVIVFRNTNIETAKRILDFSFGLSCGLGGAVEELGDRVFCVLPAGVELTQADIDKLVADGDLTR